MDTSDEQPAHYENDATEQIKNDIDNEKNDATNDKSEATKIEHGQRDAVNLKTKHQIDQIDTKNQNNEQTESENKPIPNKDKKKKKKSKIKSKKKSKKKQKKKETKIQNQTKLKKIEIKKKEPEIIEINETTEIQNEMQQNQEEIKEQISVLSDTEKQLFAFDNDTYNGAYNGYKSSRSQFQGFVEFPKKPQKSMQIQRVSYLLKQYQAFNDVKTLDQDVLVYRFIRDGNIDENICEYNVEHLLNDYYYGLVHYTHNEALYQYITTQIGALCDIKTCQFIKRNHFSNILSSEMNDITDISNEERENINYYYEFTEQAQHARIQILDKIHTHLCHSYDIGFRLTTNEKDNVHKNEEKQNENEAIDDNKQQNEGNLMDYKIVNMRRIIRKKRKHLISIIGKQNYEKNKFVTSIGQKKERQTSMFNLGDILRRQSTNITLPQLSDDDNNYKLGQKFYYWSYYKSAGWKWYIESHFEHLKEEMIGNDLVNISEWNMYYNKASDANSTFLSKSYTAHIEKHFGTYFYGIKENEKLSINNIMSVLLFCNGSLQQKLHATYIKKLDGESDEQLKKRHSNYVKWAKLLCETVEIFRNTTFYMTINDFYHGTNCCMYFDEIYASLYAPTSMTKSMEVIMCYGNESGLLLDLMYINNNHRYFECNWISNWIGENEILFVGSSKLYFKSIIHYSLCHNYTNYISAITKIEDMLHGNPADQMITKPIIKAVDELINYELKKDSESTIAITNTFVNSIFAKDKVADYVFEFFHHFVRNINYHITMDMYIMLHDYKSINKYFLNKKKTFVSFDMLCFIFRNVKYISLSPGWSLQQNCAVQLTHNHMVYLYNVLKSFVNFKNNINPDQIDEHTASSKSKYPNIVCKLERISIENPRCDILSIRDAVNDFKDMYQEIGWEITHNKWRKGDTGTPVLTIVKNK